MFYNVENALASAVGRGDSAAGQRQDPSIQGREITLESATIEGSDGVRIGSETPVSPGTLPSCPVCKVFGFAGTSRITARPELNPN
jgi:hypothetical protein